MNEEPGFSFSSFKMPAKAWEWIFRLVLLCIVLWMRSNFVSLTEFSTYKEVSEARRAAVIDRLDAIRDTLTRIDEKMKSDSRRDIDLDDLKKRVRELEMHKP